MTWADYTVTVVEATGRRTYVVRALSERDAEYVATTPCKRNYGHPVAARNHTTIVFARVAKEQ